MCEWLGLLLDAHGKVHLHHLHQWFWGTSIGLLVSFHPILLIMGAFIPNVVLPKNASRDKNQQILSFQQKM